MSEPDARTHIIAVCLAILAAVALGFSLHWLRPVMIPFALALLFMYGLAPVVDWIMIRGRVGKGVAIILSLLFTALVLIAVAQLLESSIEQVRENKDVYTQRAEELAAQARALLARWDIGLDSAFLEDAIRKLPVGSWVDGITGAMVTLISNGFLVLVFLIYLLMGRDPAAAGEGIRAEIERRIKRYIVVKVGLSALTGVATALVLQLLGVDLAMVFGLLAFLLNFIPNVGSIVATVLPLTVVLFDPDAGAVTMVLAVALPGAIQLGVGNVLEPKILGDSLELHPITILLTLIFWGMLWGVVGMILATPLAAVMKILFENLEMTRPLARLMSGRFGESSAAPVEGVEGP